MQTAATGDFGIGLVGVAHVGPLRVDVGGETLKLDEHGTARLGGSIANLVEKALEFRLALGEISTAFLHEEIGIGPHKGGQAEADWGWNSVHSLNPFSATSGKEAHKRLPQCRRCTIGHEDHLMHHVDDAVGARTFTKSPEALGDPRFEEHHDGVLDIFAALTSVQESCDSSRKIARKRSVHGNLLSPEGFLM